MGRLLPSANVDCDVPSLVERMKLASKRISQLLSLGARGIEF